MRRITCSPTRFLTAFAVLAVLAAFVTTHRSVRAQDGPGTVTATVYGCPAGITAFLLSVPVAGGDGTPGAS